MSTIETIADRGEDALDFDVTSAAVLAGLFGEREAPRVGRYRLGRQIGQGAMGRVYRAHDPDLDREVAIKMIHVDGRDDPRARARLVREAQALARVSHPNVVGVFEVGTHGRDVFVAMEWLRGRTLRRWHAEEHPAPTQCLPTLIQAGHGLAAAHRAGVVHRDFKPDNVLVADDGRVRVIDFGLAQTGALEAAPPSPSEGGGVDMASGGSITRTGAVLGSPAYMPPEQLMTAEVDALSDQFAFCVTAFEMLHGERPFAGRTPAEVVSNVVDGRIRVVSDDVPPRIDRVLRRGLACDPADRWPTMDALLEQLGVSRSSRGRIVVASVGAVVVLGLGLAATGRESHACAADEDSLAGVWDPSRRDEVAERLGATGETIGESLDAYARGWLETREAACREASASDVDEAEEAEAVAELDARRARILHCLRRRKADLRASVDLLRVADARTREHAEAVVAGLAMPEQCIDAGDDASDREPADPREARQIALVEDALSQAAALEHAGHYDEAVAAIQPAMQPLPPQPWLQAEVRHRHASCLGNLKRTTEAIEQAQQAFFIAQRIGDDALAVELATLVSCYAGWDQADQATGEAWVGHAEAILRRLDEPPKLASDLEWCRARIESQAGDADAAVESFRRAIGLAERAGVGRMRIAMLEHDLASALIDAGRLSEARPLLEGSLATLERLLGPDHPQVATSHNTVGTILAMSGDFEGARPHFEASLRIRRLTDPHGIDVAMALGSLGNLAQVERRFADARVLLEDALVRFEAISGPAGPYVEATLGNLAANATSRGDLDEARRLLRRRIELVTVHRGEDHPSLGTAHNLLGDVELEAGALPQAETHYRKAVDILERRRGAEHPALGFPLTGLGAALREQGKLEESETVLRRALALRTGPDVDPEERTDTEDALALTLRAMNPSGSPQTSG